MSIELSKDKSFKNSLLKANLDNRTLGLVNSGANISSIKKSLILNMDSNNIVEYRKLIYKAEEEENRAERKEKRKITDRQFETIVRLTAELEQIPESDVDRTKITGLSKVARERIKDLRAELKTRKTIGVDESDDETTLEEISELEGGTFAGGKTKRQTTLESAKESDLLKEKAEKNKARENLLRAQNWLTELNSLVNKLKIKKKGDGLSIQRMAEYQVFGMNRTESNEVINLIKDIMKLNKKGQDYLVEKYKPLLQNFDTNNKNVLVPITVKDKKSKPQMNKVIFVDNLQEGYNILVEKTFLKDFTLLDILEEMHRKQHGKQPKSTMPKGTRKRELQDFQRLLTGKVPKDEARFKKLKKLVKQLKNSVLTNSAKRNQYEEKLKELNDMSNDLDALVARKVKKLMSSLTTLSGFDKLDEANKLIGDIRNNPKKYVDELQEELQEDIEIEEAKIRKIIVILGTEKMVSAPLTRVSKMLKKVELLTESTGKDISGELKELFAKLPVHVINLRRYSKKITKQTADLDDVIEEAFDEWGLEDNKVLTIDSAGLGFKGVSDIGIGELEKLETLKDKFQKSVDEIENIMNEIDGLLSAISDDIKEDMKPLSEEELAEQEEEANLTERGREIRVADMRNRKITQRKPVEGDAMADYDYGDYGED